MECYCLNGLVQRIRRNLKIWRMGENGICVFLLCEFEIYKVIKRKFIFLLKRKYLIDLDLKY